MTFNEVLSGASPSDVSELISFIGPEKAKFFMAEFDTESTAMCQYARLALYALNNPRKGIPLVKHHIVPRCLMRGDSIDPDSRNLVQFTTLEHWMAHKLIVDGVKGLYNIRLRNACFLIAQDIPKGVLGDTRYVMALDTTDYNVKPNTFRSHNSGPVVKYSVRQKNKYRGTLNWYGRVACGGKHIEMSLNTESEEKAMEWLRTQEENLRRYLDGDDTADVLTPYSHSLNVLTPASTIDEYLLHCTNVRKLSKASIDTYARNLKKVVGWCVKHDIVDLYTFNAKHAQELIASQKMADVSLKVFINVARCFFDYLKAQSLIQYNPFANVVSPRVNYHKPRERKTWTSEQMDTILQNAPRQDIRAYWSVLRYCGTRSTETANIEWSQVDLERGIIMLPDRNVPIPEKCSMELRKLPERTGKLFPRLPKDEGHRNRQLVSVIAKLGISGSLSIFRNSWIANTLTQGLSVSDAAKIIGVETVNQLDLWRKQLSAMCL